VEFLAGDCTPKASAALGYGGLMGLGAKVVETSFAPEAKTGRKIKPL